MIKYVTWSVLVVTFVYIICSTNEINVHSLSIAILFTLLSIISELKDFNFWGLKGTKENIEKAREIEINSKSIEPSIDVDPSTDREPVKTEESIVPLMDTTMGNFLAYAFEIERLLRIFGKYILKNDKVSTMAMGLLVTKLREAEGLSDQGEKNMRDILWLRNMLVHGNVGEITQETLKAGEQIAKSLYLDLYNWFNPETPS